MSGKIRLSAGAPAKWFQGLTAGQYYRITWQLLIIIAAGLAISAGAVRPYVLLPFFAVAYLRMTPYSAILRERRGRVLFGISLALVLLGIDQVARFSRFEDLVDIMIELISGIVPLLILDHERPRRYWLTVLNVTIVAIGSITFASTVLVYFGFLLYVGVLLFNLNAATLFQARLAAGSFAGEDALGPLPRGYFRQFLYVLPAGIASAILIFLAFPRVQNFNFSLGNLIGQNKIGYSGAVELNAGGEMVATGVLAFRVDSGDHKWLQAKGTSLHFRGDSLDTFDGVRWKSTVFNFHPVSQVQDLRVASKHAEVTHVLTVHREGMPTAAIFYPGSLVNLLDRSHGAGNFLFNANGSMIRDTFNLEPFTYSVKVANLAPPDQWDKLPLGQFGGEIKTLPRSEAFPSELSEKDLETYLAVPAVVADAPWYQAWVKEVGINPRESIAMADRRISAHFGAKFVPALSNKFSGPNALQSFLTTDRQGHCEYFATAEALLLRTLGVPSRVVVGYHGGRFNDLINLIEVSEDDAHAWVEAFLPGTGWIELDPTPGSNVNAHDDEFQITRYANALSFWFREYVVDYNHETQRDLLKTLGKMAVKEADPGASFKEKALAYIKPLLVGVLCLVGAVLIVLGVRGRRQKTDIPAYYAVFLKKLRKKGLSRQPHETYREFHARAAAGGIDAKIVADFDRAVERDFFSAHGLDAGEASQLLRQAGGM